MKRKFIPSFHLTYPIDLDIDNVIIGIDNLSSKANPFRILCRDKDSDAEDNKFKWYYLTYDFADRPINFENDRECLWYIEQLAINSKLDNIEELVIVKWTGAGYKHYDIDIPSFDSFQSELYNIVYLVYSRTRAKYHGVEYGEDIHIDQFRYYHKASHAEHYANQLLSKFVPGKYLELHYEVYICAMGESMAIAHVDNDLPVEDLEWSVNRLIGRVT